MSDMGREIRAAILTVLGAWERGELVLTNGQDDAFDPEMLKAIAVLRKATVGTVPAVK